MILNGMKERQRKLRELEPLVGAIVNKFEKVANLHQFKYADQLRDLGLVLQRDLCGVGTP